MMNARVYARKPDKRGGMMDERVGDVSVPAESPQPATEEKAPAPKTYAVKDSEAIASVAAPVQEAPQAVQKEPETIQKKPYTHWWQTPDYLGEVERRAASAEKRAEQEKKRVRRERYGAILGDLAKLAAQSGVIAGGAWKVDAFTPETQKVNDKHTALRERHAAEVAAFAKERAAARQAQNADNNARMKLETNLAEADIDRRIKAANRAEDMQVKTTELAEKMRHNAAMEGVYTAREQRLKGQGGSGTNRNYIRVFMPNGESKIYDKGTYGDTWVNRAYEESKRAGMPKCMKTVTVRDEYGRSTTKEVEETSLPKLKAWIEEWSYGNELKGGSGMDLGLTDDNNLNLN